MGMKRIAAMSLLILLAAVQGAYGHGLTNERTLYDDSEYISVREELTYLRGLGVIASNFEDGNRLFRPMDKLTKAELAFWAARFAGLAGYSDTREHAANTALREGLMEALQGMATYADVNRAYFQGKAPVAEPEQQLTREQFVVFMAIFLTEQVDGQTLFERRGFIPGPAGVMTRVTHELKIDEEANVPYKEYTAIINGESYKVDDHGRVIRGPIELSAWEGKEVAESWLVEDTQGERRLILIAAREGQFSAEEISNTEIDLSPGAEDGRDIPMMLPIGMVLLIGIVAWLVLKRKK